MELLKEKNYDKLTEPVKEVKINNLFARSVIEKKIAGKIFVDNTENPETFYVVHPYGMSLLFGNSQNPDFNAQFLDYSLNRNKVRDKHEWLQAYPIQWDKVLFEIYDGCMIKSAENTAQKGSGIIELNTRVNFKFNPEKYMAGKRVSLPAHCSIRKTDNDAFEKMSGTVIPSFFWDGADDFAQNSIGYSLFCEDKLVATAYAAFILEDKLEIGIETVPGFRGKGFAYLACAALIDYCYGNGYEPVWACRLENIGSYALAQKLGFEVSTKIPYYRLSN